MKTQQWYLPSCGHIYHPHPGSRKWTDEHWSDLSQICSHHPENIHKLQCRLSNNWLPLINLHNICYIITGFICFLPDSLMACCILQSPRAWCRRWMAQPDWLLSLLLCSGPLKPPAHRRQWASPVDSKQTRKRTFISVIYTFFMAARDIKVISFRFF